MRKGNEKEGWRLRIIKREGDEEGRQQDQKEGKRKDGHKIDVGPFGK